MTTTTAKPPVLPGSPQRHNAGNVVIELANTGHSYTVTIAHLGGALIPQLTRALTTEADAREVARNAYRFFTAGGRAVEQVDGSIALVPARQRRTPVAAGTQAKVSDPQVGKLLHAIVNGGHIRRGGQQHQATHSTLIALAKRGYLTLTGPKYRPTGGDITRTGRVAYLRASGADRITYTLAA